MDKILNEMADIADKIAEIVPEKGWTPQASSLSKRLQELAEKLQEETSEKEEQPEIGTVTADDIQKMVDEARLRILANES